MTRLVKSFVTAVVAAVASVAAQAGNLENPTYPLSPVEQLYADLFKLPPAERQAKLLEGAKKEGKFESIQAMGGSLGANHTKMFREAFPMLPHAETQLGSQQAIERLIAEERADRHLTDATGSDTAELSDILEYGYLARYPTPATEKILPQYKSMMDPHNRWVLNLWSEQGISYNSQLLEQMKAPPPKSYMDLCDPRFKNNISFEPIRNRFLVFLNAMWGEEKTVEFLKCLGANDPILMRGQSVRLNLMIAGDHAIQGNNFFYYGTLQRDQHGEKKVPFKAVYEAPILAAGAGCVINRNAPHPHSAALYCDWQLDEKAQKSLKDGYRGTVTLSHAFLPANVELVAVKAEAVSLVDKLQEHWKKYVQKRG